MKKTDLEAVASLYRGMRVPDRPSSSLVRFRRAAAGLSRMLRKPPGGYRPQDVNALQDLIDSGRYRAIVRRMRHSASGRRLLSEQPSIYDGPDLEELSRLPEDTLGGAFARFMLEHELDPNVSEPHDADEAALAYAKARHREAHDLVHVLLNLGVSPRDEVCVQAFTLGQNPRWMSAALVLGGLLKYGRLAGHPPMWRELVAAYRVGKRGEFLMNTRWESLWATPLAPLRAELGLATLG